MNISKGENLKINGIVVLIYGEPGIGKTSLAINCKNPLIFDFDNGVQRSEFRAGKDVVRITSWKEVDDDLKNFDNIIKNYDNVVIDTVDNCLSYIRMFLEDGDIKLKRNQLQMYGKLKDNFDYFLKRITKSGKNVILIAHSTLEEIDGKSKSTPKITGGSKDIVKSCADFVGYCFSENNKRNIDFNPTDFWWGKNSAKFPRLIIPDFNLEPDYFQTKLNEMKISLEQVSKEQSEILATLKIYNDQVKEIENLENLESFKNSILGTLNKNLELQILSKIDNRKIEIEISNLKSIIDLFTDINQYNELVEKLTNADLKVKSGIWNYLQNSASGYNLKFNKETKKFENLSLSGVA